MIIKVGGLEPLGPIGVYAYGATVLKVGGGIKRDSRAKKNFVPPSFGKVGGIIFYMWGYEQGNKYHY